MARPPLPIAEDFVLESFRRGESLQGIAKKLGVGRSRVTRVVDNAGLRPGKGRPLSRRIAPEGTVDSPTVCHRAGISYRQLDYWTTQGLLTPVMGRNPGSGWSRFYPIEQVHRAATLRHLFEVGMTQPTCARIIDDLMATGTARINDALTIHLQEPA